MCVLYVHVWGRTCVRILHACVKATSANISINNCTHKIYISEGALNTVKDKQVNNTIVVNVNRCVRFTIS